MKVPNSPWSKPLTWPRRDFLKTISAVAASAVFPANALSSATAGKSAASFSHFVDIAESAGLKDVMFYGEKAQATYITEIMGGGCAFFDYDNDGWMDIFILGGRRLSEIPVGASNRLYHNNRDGTFTDVTKEAGLLDSGWAVGVIATAGSISS